MAEVVWGWESFFRQLRSLLETWQRDWRCKWRIQWFCLGAPVAECKELNRYKRDPDIISQRSF